MLERISDYRIIREIGAGGMGEVYEAVDERLGRRVALKLLPAEMGADRKRLNRFLQEARLAAKLNHPNICTVYEVGDAAETPFLAMELVEGETLDRRIDNGPLDLHEILQIASQMADALDEAHQNGIIHRDIKASNIIINRRGQVKVLDFGLAKPISEEVSEMAVTRARTEDGMLVGTVQYMSPEQALGKRLDARTDLWSLGVLLYEMICGELPFRAATQAGTFDKILHKDPRPPSEINAGTLPELENIILKLLDKDRDLRYQTATDLLADLKRLRRMLGDVSYSEETARRSTGEIPARTESGFRAPTGPQTSPLLRRSWLAASLLVLLAAGLAAFLYAVWPSPAPISAGSWFETAASSRVTNLGKVFDAVISPDGNYIVYVTDDGARQSLWLKQTATGSVVQVLPPSENIFQGIAVAPDNNWIYLNVWDRKSVGQIFRVPALGGVPEKIVHDCMPGLSVSPDGGRLTFVRSEAKTDRAVLLTAATDGSAEREVYSSTVSFLYSPVWAPDGQSIAFGMFQSEGGRRFPQIAEISAAGGEVRAVWNDTDNQFYPHRFVWLPDKSGLLVTLNNSREFQSQIWRIDYADGSLRQVTRDLNSYNSLSISRDGRNLLGIQQDYLLSVWVMPADGSDQAKRITEGKTEGVGLDWTPDGSIVYASNVSGAAEIWSMKADGSAKKQLTSGRAMKLNPCVSSDGRYVFHNVMDKERGGSGRIDIDGKNHLVLEDKWTVTCAARAPHVFYFSEEENGHPKLFRDSPEMNRPVRLIDDSASKTLFSPARFNVKMIQSYAASPDGEHIAYIFWDEEKRGFGAEIVTLETGAVREFELPPTAAQKYSESQFVVRWTPDGKNLSFVNDENGFSNVWLLPLSGEKPRKITDFNDNFVFSFAWSRDGKRLAVSRGTVTSDAILFRQN